MEGCFQLPCFILGAIGLWRSELVFCWLIIGSSNGSPGSDALKKRGKGSFVRWTRLDIGQLVVASIFRIA